MKNLILVIVCVLFSMGVKGQSLTGCLWESESYVKSYMTQHYTNFSIDKHETDGEGNAIRILWLNDPKYYENDFFFAAIYRFNNADKTCSEITYMCFNKKLPAILMYIDQNKLVKTSDLQWVDPVTSTTYVLETGKETFSLTVFSLKKK